MADLGSFPVLRPVCSGGLTAPPGGESSEMLRGTGKPGLSWAPGAMPSPAHNQQGWQFQALLPSPNSQVLRLSAIDPAVTAVHPRGEGSHFVDLGAIMLPHPVPGGSGGSSSRVPERPVLGKGRSPGAAVARQCRTEPESLHSLRAAEGRAGSPKALLATWPGY